MDYFNYITTNIINKKQYIGAHGTNNINDRYLGSGKLIGKAIKKYKKENFTRVILEFFDTFEEALKNETPLIKEYNTLAPNGYNLHPEGGGSWNIKGRKTIYKDNKEKRVKKEELLQYFEEGWKLGLSKEHEQKLSETNSGEKNGMYGKCHSKKSIQKMKESTDNKSKKNPMYGTSRRHICNEKLNKNKFVKKEKLQYYLDSGWELGFLEESKQNIRNGSKGNTNVKGKRWIHNKKLNKEKLVDKEEISFYLDMNWELKRKSKEKKYVNQ